MTASERILQLLDERKISQKEFSDKTGIPQSTISDWRKKKTNPASDKIKEEISAKFVERRNTINHVDFEAEKNQLLKEIQRLKARNKK